MFCNCKAFTAACRHCLLLRADEVHHRGPGAAELRAEEGIQREVSEAEDAMAVLFNVVFSMPRVGRYNHDMT